MINLPSLIDHAKCVQVIRAMRWPDGLKCPGCGSREVIKDGRDDTQPERQRYRCHGCGKRFDDLSGTIFAGHHQPLPVWVLCLYFMGLNLSNEQIAPELGIDPDDAQVMASQLRQGIVEGKPEVSWTARSSATRFMWWPGTKVTTRPSRKKGGPPRRRRLKGDAVAGARWPRRSRQSWG